MVTRYFNLFLNNGAGSALIIRSNQFESDEQWVFTLYEENGSKYTPIAGELVGLKSDGHIIARSCTVDSEGRIVVNCNGQLATAPGKAEFELILSGLHKTANFIVDFEASPINPTAKLSEADLQAVYKAIDNAVDSAEVKILESRFNEIIASETPPENSELIDIRTDVNGKTWDLAGNAVREQVSDLNAALIAKTKSINNGIENGYDVVPLTWTQSKRITSDGRELGGNTSFYITDAYYPIDKYAYVFSLKDIAFYADLNCTVAFYDNQKNFISSLVEDNVYVLTENIPANAEYMRFCHCSIKNPSIPVSDINLRYDYYERLENIENDISELQGEIGTYVALSSQFKNLLYGNREYLNNKILTTGGVLSDNQNWITCIDYIPVEEGKYYGFQTYLPKAWLNAVVAWYKSDKTHIQNEPIQTNSTGWTAPTNAAYARISVVNTNFSPNGLENFDDAFFAEIENTVNGGRLVHCVDSKFIMSNLLPFIPLYGKKWALFGDSITQKNNRSTANYHDYIRARTGCIVSNYAIGGAGYLSQADVGDAVFQLVKYNENALSDFDMITIFAGVNDCMFFPADRLGSVTDTWIDTEDFYTNDENSIMRCFAKAIEEIHEAAPLVPIGIIFPLPVTHNSHGTMIDFRPSNEPNKMSAFIDACKEYCITQGIPYLDLFHASNMMPWNQTQNETLFKCVSDDSPDGLHPNALGHIRIANKIEQFVTELVK